MELIDCVDFVLAQSMQSKICQYQDLQDFVKPSAFQASPLLRETKKSLPLQARWLRFIGDGRFIFPKSRFSSMLLDKFPSYRRRHWRISLLISFSNQKNFRKTGKIRLT
jgi:hypothetical protein